MPALSLVSQVFSKMNDTAGSKSMTSYSDKLKMLTPLVTEHKETETRGKVGSEVHAREFSPSISRLEWS